MSGWGHHDDPTDRSGARHRQGTGWFSLVWSRLVNPRRPSRREWLVGAGALVVLALLGLGYVTINSREQTGNDALPPGVTPSAAVPSAELPSEAPPAASAPPSPTAPGPTAPPEEGNGNGGEGNDGANGNEGGDPPPGSANQPEPRLVGPRDFTGFEKLLSEFCRDRGDFLRAALLPDREGEKANGQWACVQIVTFEPINLDEPCRKEFGEGSQARQLARDDERTWRCFDR